MTSTPKATAGCISICGACGTTCYVDESGTAWRARAENLNRLTEEQIQTLRRERSPLVDRRKK